MNIRPKAFLLVFVSFTFVSCTRNYPRGFERTLVSSIETSCHAAQPCVIRIRDLTDFSWDQMYVFKYTASREEVRKTLGMAPPRYSEFLRKVVFMNRGKIVLYGEYPTDVERPIDHEVVFDIGDREFERTYGQDVAFQVSAVESEDGRYFELRTVAR